MLPSNICNTNEVVVHTSYHVQNILPDNILEHDIESAVDHLEHQIRLAPGTNPGVFFKDASNIVEMRSDLFYFDTGCIRFENNSVNIKYRFSDAQISKMKKAFESNLAIITVELIRLNKSKDEISKMKYIHDFIAKQTTYAVSPIDNDDQYLCHTAYGVIVNHHAVCNGYSKAAALLLGKAGIECSIVNGTYHGIPHSWNKIIIQNEPRYMDITLDDDIHGQISNKYFNISREEMEKDHSFTS
jgi:hypothetical protein